MRPWSQTRGRFVLPLGEGLLQRYNESDSNLYSSPQERHRTVIDSPVIFATVSFSIFIEFTLLYRKNATKSPKRPAAIPIIPSCSPSIVTPLVRLAESSALFNPNPIVKLPLLFSQYLREQPRQTNSEPQLRRVHVGMQPFLPQKYGPNRRLFPPSLWLLRDGTEPPMQEAPSIISITRTAVTLLCSAEPSSKQLRNGRT